MELGALEQITCFAVFLLEKRVDLAGRTFLAFYLENSHGGWYGDDHVSTWTNFVKDLGWNQRTLAYYMKSIWNIEMTMPDKSPELSEWIPLEQITLLKRTFEVRDGWVYAPLEKQVIYDLLQWVNDASRATEIMINNCDDAVLESVHHGREFYDHIVDLLTEGMGRKGIKWIARDYHYIDKKIRGGEIVAPDHDAWLHSMQ